jgi:lipopolysaccharide/colanic/teichoic acid biosynthesis glycosyltransferase
MQAEGIMTAKFLFDRFFAFAGLVALSPVFLVVALLIRFRMPDGPVLFRQVRIGKDGKPFRLVKFRTMAGDQTGETVTVAGDNRITPLGARLRRYKLDELPELWNVLMGDMSFVGPRPDVPGYADALTGDDREILRLRPGITGPATLKYRNEEELLATVDDPKHYNDEVIFPDKVRINRYYLHHPSFRMDLKMILATVFGFHFDYGGERI